MLKQLKEVSYIFRNLKSKSIKVIPTSFQFEIEKVNEIETNCWLIIPYASGFFFKPHI